MEDQGQKRASAGDDGPPEKRLKGEPEDTEVYSQRIKKKLQANSRTGQACDRCKERKMKCDSGQDGCQQCQSKNFRCVATDRITGHTYERGETARLKKEVEELRTQVDAYRQHFELHSPAHYPMSGSYQAYTAANGYSSNPPQNQQISAAEHPANTEFSRLNKVDGPHRGPICGTTIDFVDGEIDIGAYVCPDMAETMRISQETIPLINSCRTSLTTSSGAQKPERPQMPSRDEALQYIDNYLKIIAPYVPIVHGPTFRKQVADFYDYPTRFEDKPAETVMIMVVLAIFAHQMAIRNPPMRQEKLAESNRLYHYSLSYYPELLQGDSLAKMQALALFLVHARNLPKPGNSWSLSSMILARAIELNYHRSTNKIVLPPEQQNVLAVELRKRVFWSILGIQVTIAVKMGRPMAISSADMDVELPLAILDSEITEHEILSSTGKCDFWGHIFLSKKLPLLMDLYKNVILVRKSAAEYCRDVDELDTQITKWRLDWNQETADQTKNGSYQIATHLVDLWYAEYRLTLHHPQLCTSQAVEVREKNLDICLEASRTMLRNVMSLIRDFKGADFTWHFASGYVLGMGMAMHVYNKRRDRLNIETLNKMKLELHEWLFVMRSSDHFTKSGDYLFKIFQPRAQQCLDDAQDVVTASEALRNGYHHGGQPQPQPAEAQTQTQHNFSVSEPYHQHSAAYSDTLPANTIPTTTGGALPQQHNTYNVQPPPQSSTSSSQHNQQQQYDNTNNRAYQMPLPQHSTTSTTTTPSAPNNHATMPFVSDPNPYPHSHHTYQTASTSSLYSPHVMAYPTSTIPDNFSSGDVYSIPPGMWPASIVQYQNGGI